VTDPVVGEALAGKRGAIMSNLRSVAALAVAFLACAATVGWPQAGPGGRREALRVTGPFVYENLDVYLIRGPGAATSRKVLTLERALAEKKVVVRETGAVSQLTIENLSSEEVFVQAGEIVKGGRQDRVLGTDMILHPGSGQVPIASHCVEQGRWQKRGTEPADQFASSQALAASKDLKIANYKGAQGEVWANVAKVQQKLNDTLGTDVRSRQSASSLQLTLENDRVRLSVDAYVKALAGVAASSADVLGYAFAVNGEINSAEVYASTSLFLDQWPKLLRASATEAVAERKTGVSHQPPSPDSVRSFLEAPDAGPATVKNAGQSARVVSRETASRLVVETQAAGGGGWVHRSYLRK
jgi:hypothetical protein